MRRPSLAFWLVGLFILVPIVEIYVIIQVGQWIGAIPTLLLLVVESLIGAWVVRREGRRAWGALRDTIRAGTVPGKELIDGALVLIGGTLLLTPGFVTDVVGFFFVLPFTRPFARRLVQVEVNRRAARRMTSPYAPRSGDTHRIYRDDDPYL
jgi:UPF0716 protein FxsA